MGIPLSRAYVAMSEGTADEQEIAGCPIEKSSERMSERMDRQSSSDTGPREPEPEPILHAPWRERPIPAGGEHRQQAGAHLVSDSEAVVGKDLEQPSRDVPSFGAAAFDRRKQQPAVSKVEIAPDRSRDLRQPDAGVGERREERMISTGQWVD